VGAAVKGSTVNGWTYFEHKITGVTSVSVGATGSVDELRMYPDDAQMKTYTYSQGIGCTSVCDENNQVQYYQYDGLGRIICVRNMDGYILNYYQYKMQSIVNQ
jgi:YD repeat-containing protein